ncbi:hypothetical protein WJX73_004526 [Symbiochloris irregularis]|uniref:Uncharacterized protein n=1 Tax=Symbiochloris irregularis TaxID=706552 RepID=A0AAW1NTT6_9CHLO
MLLAHCCTPLHHQRLSAAWGRLVLRPRTVEARAAPFTPPSDVQKDGHEHDCNACRIRRMHSGRTANTEAIFEPEFLDQGLATRNADGTLVLKRTRRGRRSTSCVLLRLLKGRSLNRPGAATASRRCP